jgi:hypothetical protein
MYVAGKEARMNAAPKRAGSDPLVGTGLTKAVSVEGEFC